MNQQLQLTIINFLNNQKTMKKLLLIFGIAFSINTKAQCWSQISAGAGHTIAIKTDGTLWAWGDNSTGQLGDGTTVNKQVPVQIGTSNTWSQISAGAFHNLALKANGTLWCWLQPVWTTR